jgi:hypothetical protein
MAVLNALQQGLFTPDTPTFAFAAAAKVKFISVQELAIVGRFTADRRGLHYLDRFCSPPGDISFPVMTLPSMRDPVAPLFHETDYATRAPEAWLVQRTVNSFGHCAINQQEVLTAFDDLVRWVTEGHRPAGGDATIR